MISSSFERLATVQTTPCAGVAPAMMDSELRAPKLPQDLFVLLSGETSRTPMSVHTILLLAK